MEIMCESGTKASARCFEAVQMEFLTPLLQFVDLQHQYNINIGEHVCFQLAFEASLPHNE
jgi:hypothetical protein